MKFAIGDRVKIVSVVPEFEGKFGRVEQQFKYDGIEAFAVDIDGMAVKATILGTNLEKTEKQRFDKDDICLFNYYNPARLVKITKTKNDLPNELKHFDYECIDVHSGILYYPVESNLKIVNWQ